MRISDGSSDVCSSDLSSPSRGSPPSSLPCTSRGEPSRSHTCESDTVTPTAPTPRRPAAFFHVLAEAREVCWPARSSEPDVQARLQLPSMLQCHGSLLNGTRP